MIDGAVKRYLNRVYNCKIVKVGTHRTMIKSQRRKKLGVKYKILGIFPIYKYEECDEYLFKMLMTMIYIMMDRDRCALKSFS